MNAPTKKFSFLTLTTLVGVVTVMGIGVAFAGIQGSKHDLGAGGASQFGAGGGGSGEVCVFCHTPHGSATSASVPLWNRALPGSTYTRYSALNTSTLDGAETAVGSVSLACLSCHDGTQAMNVLINAPGSGAGTPPAGVNMSGTGTTFPNLGTDLSNDHPISIQYAGGGLVSTDADGAYTNTAFKDKDFNSVYKATINSVPSWWVDSNADGLRQKTEMMLYTRTMGTIQPFVECASCHDPHNAATAAANQVAFLRTSNTNSEVCLACHNK